MSETPRRTERSELLGVSAPLDAVAPAEASVKVKVCGITNLDDAEMAVELGAWTLGMIFYEDSPRRCSLGEAQRIVARLRRKVELC